MMGIIAEYVSYCQIKDRCPAEGGAWYRLGEGEDGEWKEDGEGGASERSKPLSPLSWSEYLCSPLIIFFPTKCCPQNPCLVLGL